MGILAFIDKVCVQTACYWGSPVEDGYGGYTYTTAIEIKCRWDDVSEKITNQKGNEIISNAQLLITQDLNEEGFLWLGALTSLTTAQKADPLKVEKAYPIQKLEKSPLFKSTNKFVRKVYL